MAARKWRENEKMKRKWRENEEMEREWGNRRLNLRHLSQVSQKSLHTPFEKIVMDRTQLASP